MENVTSLGKQAWFPGFRFVNPLVLSLMSFVHMLPKTLLIPAIIHTSQNCHCVCTGHMPTNVTDHSIYVHMLHATQSIFQA